MQEHHLRFSSEYSQTSSGAYLPWACKLFCSSANLSCNSHTSSSLKLFFFLLSLSFFSTSLIAFLMSLASMGLFFLTPIARTCLLRLLHDPFLRAHFVAEFLVVADND